MKFVEWVNAHPEWFIYIATAIVTALFRPRSQAAYDAMTPRLAGFWGMFAAFGCDVPKFQKALRVFLTGQRPPPDPPPAPPPGPGAGSEPPTKPDTPEALRKSSLRVVKFAAAFGVLAVTCAGCLPASPAQSPERATVRAAILTVAKALAVADHACADVARANANKDVARACAEAYDAARPALLSAESGVDSWSAASQDQVLCAVGNAAIALRSIGDVVTKAGGTVPSVLVDALKLTSGFGGCDAGRQ